MCESMSYSTASFSEFTSAYISFIQFSPDNSCYYSYVVFSVVCYTSHPLKLLTNLFFVNSEHGTSYKYIYFYRVNFTAKIRYKN